MTVRIYRWDDPGAPQLSTSNDGSLTTILKACLITGYGSRTPAGWSIAYENGAQKAFKLPVGTTEQILVVDDTLDYRYAEVFACSAITDMDNVTEKYPFNPIFPLRKNYWYKRYSTTDYYKEWCVVASESFVYFIQAQGASIQVCGEFFGDYTCVDPNWPYRTVVSGRMTTTPETSIQTYCYYPLFLHSDATDTYKHVRRSWNAFEYSNCYAVFNYKTKTYAVAGNSVNPLTGKIELEPLELIVDKCIMGTLPYLYTMKYPRIDSTINFFPGGFINIDSTISPNSKDMLGVSGQLTNQLFIEYDE